jgi:flagellin-like protein
MNIRRLIRRRRAVSPILAAILLIGLAVAAGAVLFTVVMPLIDNPGGSVVFDESSCEFTTNTSVHIVLKNEGTETAQITGITVESATITFVQFSINKGQGAIKDYSFTALAAGTYTITVSFTLGGETQTPIAIDLTVA